MLPATVNLEAYEGDSWRQVFRFSLKGVGPIDLSDATIEAGAKAPSGRSYTFVVDKTNAAQGLIVCSLPAGELEAETHAYDVRVTDDDGVQTWVHGRLTVTNNSGAFDA